MRAGGVLLVAAVVFTQPRQCATIAILMISINILFHMNNVGGTKIHGYIL